MGLCCDLCFSRQAQQHSNNQTLLQSAIRTATSTLNDPQFTYYLGCFQQQHLIHRIMVENRIDSSVFNSNEQWQSNKKQIDKQVERLQEYLAAIENQKSHLNSKIKESCIRISAQYPQQVGGNNCACMVKLQIQQIHLIPGISHITINQLQKHTTNTTVPYIKLQIAKIKSTPFYCELILPSFHTSSIQITTWPIFSSLTIEVEQLMLTQSLLEVFSFKDQRHNQLGDLALRMQFISNDSNYRQDRVRKLKLLKKQLSLYSEGRDLDHLSSFVSQSSNHSNRNSLTSDLVSSFPNHYQI